MASSNSQASYIPIPGYNAEELDRVSRDPAYLLWLRSQVEAFRASADTQARRRDLRVERELRAPSRSESQDSLDSEIPPPADHSVDLSTLAAAIDSTEDTREARLAARDYLSRVAPAPVRPADIASATNIPRETITLALYELEAQGQVTRHGRSFSLAVPLPQPLQAPSAFTAPDPQASSARAWVRVFLTSATGVDERAKIQMAYNRAGLPTPTPNISGSQFDGWTATITTTFGVTVFRAPTKREAEAGAFARLFKAIVKRNVSITGADGAGRLVCVETHPGPSACCYVQIVATIVSLVGTALLTAYLTFMYTNPLSVVLGSNVPRNQFNVLPAITHTELWGPTPTRPAFCPPPDPGQTEGCSSFSRGFQVMDDEEWQVSVWFAAPQPPTTDAYGTQIIWGATCAPYDQPGSEWNHCNRVMGKLGETIYYTQPLQLDTQNVQNEGIESTARFTVTGGQVCTIWTWCSEVSKWSNQQSYSGFNAWRVSNRSAGLTEVRIVDVKSVKDAEPLWITDTDPHPADTAAYAKANHKHIPLDEWVERAQDEMRPGIHVTGITYVDTYNRTAWRRRRPRHHRVSNGSTTFSFERRDANATQEEIGMLGAGSEKGDGPVHPTYKRRKDGARYSGQVCLPVQGTTDPLSNFYPSPFEHCKTVFQNGETLYQTIKLDHLGIAHDLSKCKTPQDVKAQVKTLVTRAGKQADEQQWIEERGPRAAFVVMLARYRADKAFASAVDAVNYGTIFVHTVENTFWGCGHRDVAQVKWDGAWENIYGRLLTDLKYILMYLDDSDHARLSFPWTLDMYNRELGPHAQAGMGDKAASRPTAKWKSNLTDLQLAKVEWCELILGCPSANNRFGPIEITEAEDIEDVEERSERERDKQVTQAAKKAGASVQDREGRESKRRPDVHKDKKLTPTEQERAQRFDNMVGRLWARFQRKDDAFIRWLYHQRPNLNIVRVVCDKMYGQGWRENTRLFLDQAVALAYLNKSEMTWVAKLLAEVGSNEAIASLTTTDKWVDLTRVLAADAAMHNKLVHAYNGNPVSPQDMHAVDEAPSITGLMQSTGELEDSIGLQTVSMMLNAPNMNNSTFADYTTVDRIRASAVTPANAVVQGQEVRMPVTGLIPRALRTGNAALVNSTFRLPANMGARMATLSRVNAKRTALAEDLDRATMDQRNQMLRADATNRAGFLANDLVTLNAQKPRMGMSVEQVALKLTAIQQVLSEAVPERYQPSNQYSAINEQTLPAAGNPILGNNSPVFGEPCVVNGVPVFPYGGEEGELHFHLTPASVPPERVRNAIWMPTALIEATGNPGEAIALYVMMWSKWPHTLWTITKTTTDLAGGNAGAQIYASAASVLSIPGQSIIDVIMPRKTCGPAPANQAQAAANAFIIPTTAAGVAIPYNAVGAPVAPLPLAEYLRNWFEELDLTSLAAYVARLRMFMDIDHDLEWARDLLLVQTKQFPRVYSRPPGAAATQAPAAATLRTQTMDGRSNPFYAAGNFPQATYPADSFVIVESDALMWSQAMLGLIEVEDHLPSSTLTSPTWMGAPESNVWSQARAMELAAGYQLSHFVRGVGARSLDQGLTDTQHYVLREMMNAEFASTGTRGNIRKAESGELTALMYEGATGFRAKRLKLFPEPAEGHTCYDRNVKNIARPYESPWSPAAAQSLTGLCPTLMSDVWLQFVCRKLPKSAMPWVPPGGVDSTAGYGPEHGLTPERFTAANYLGYIDPALRGPIVAFNEFPEVKDEERWNARLAKNFLGGELVDSTGARVAGQSPAGEYVYERGYPVTPGGQVAQDEFTRATLNIPVFSEPDTRVYVSVVQAAAAQLTQAEERVVRLPTPAWLLGAERRNTILQYIKKKASRFEGFIKRAENFPGTAGTPAAPAESTPEPAATPAESNPV